MVFCSKCGAQLNQGQKFCAKCGAPARNVEFSQSGKKNRIIIYMIVALLIGVGIAGITYYFLKGSKNIKQEVVDTQQPPIRMPVPPSSALTKDISERSFGEIKEKEQKNIHGWSPSFDCTKVSNGPEHLICSNRELAELDVQMADLYKAALRKSLDKEALRRQQREWLKYKRNICSDIESMMHVYQQRIAQLSQ